MHLVGMPGSVSSWDTRSKHMSCNVCSGQERDNIFEGLVPGIYLDWTTCVDHQEVRNNFSGKRCFLHQN